LASWTIPRTFSDYAWSDTVGIISAAKAFLLDRQLKRDPRAQALARHTQKYFYEGHTLSWMREENKRKIITELATRVVTTLESADPRMTLRTHLTDFVLLFAEVAVLGLTEEEKALMDYGRSPYISGQLHHRIVEAAEHSDEMGRAVFQSGGLTAPELISHANARGGVLLYYANGLNLLRVDTDDSSPNKDWFKPFVEAMLVWEEDTYRGKLDMPSLLPDRADGLRYSTFMNLVLDGEPDPFFTWTRANPGLYLAGEGSLSTPHDEASTAAASGRALS
jgi:hypothetical protein